MHMRLLFTLGASLLSTPRCLAELHVGQSSGNETFGSENTSQDVSKNDILRRNADIEAQFARSPVHGVKKMEPDPGQKFYLDYWNFVDDSQGRLRERDGSARAEIEEPLHDNTTIGSASATNELIFPKYFPLEASLPQQASSGNMLGRRDFKCPTDTSACTSIDRSDRCCSTGDTCEIVKDTGSGDVGCCGQGLTCSGEVGLCPNQYKTCPQSLGGGCCIPGYECVEGGCAYIAVVTITVHSSVTISTVTYSTSPQTPTSSHTSAQSTNTQTTDSLVPPARPTSLTTQTHATTSRVDVCPTGFYACSAVYHGGCCQTGRNCDTTSCPTVASTTFTSDGATIVEPAATGESGSGSCAKGWFNCADSAGGGCCPSGFACGASCTATQSIKTTVSKEDPTGTAQSGGTEIHSGAWGLILAFSVILRVMF